MPKLKLFTATLLVASMLAACDRQPQFDENYAKAKENVRTPSGAEYDRQLSVFVQNLSGFPLAVEDCVVKNPGQSEVHGYFEIKSAQEYRVVIRPENGFAACLTLELQNQSIPAPPQVPYLSPFDLSLKS